MHLFRVWGPKAQTVDVVVNGRAHPMTPERDGWWIARVEDAGAGTDYLFSVDGMGPVPDPRSEWQPDGVHGPSRVVDHAFEWSDHGWVAPPLESGIVYELHIGTFTPEGTFDSAAHRLGYLKGLGITHVEIMPVNEFSGLHGWGYDGVDLFAPHEAYGGPAGLKRFVDACHRTGLAVVIDVVYNHFGPCGNYLNRFGPYTHDAHHTPWGSAVNLDGPLSAEVRQFFFDDAMLWLREYHADGLRLDAVHALIDQGACHFLEELSERVDTFERESGRRLVLIAESDLNDPRIVTPRERGGYGIDAQWSDDFHHSLHTVLTGETTAYYSDFGSMEQLAKALRQAFVYDGSHSAYRDRSHGRPPSGLSGHRFLAYIQNHDQIGNRVNGERISNLVGLGRARIAAALVLTSPFIPMLFQGEEWAASTPFQYFTGHEDEHLGRAVSEGRRSEFSCFGWAPEDVPDPQHPDTYDRSKLDWQELNRPRHRDMLDWYKSLIRFRRSTPELLDGDLGSVVVRCDDESGWLTMQRRTAFVACNFAEAPRTVPVPRPADMALQSKSGVQLNDRNIALPAGSVAILTLS